MPDQFADREGTFRATIREYGLHEGAGDSKSVGVNILVDLTDIWYEGEFQPWSEYGQCAYGYVNLIQKDGSVNTQSCESFMKATGWDGDLSSLDNKTWQPKPCQVRIKAEEYEGKTKYKVAYVNGYDDVPGGGGIRSCGAHKAKQLAIQYGSQFRAIAGSVKQNATKPNGKPPAPPMRIPTQEELAKLPAEDSETPF